MNSCDVKTKPSFWRKWIPVFVMALGLAIIIIDTTLLNVSIKYLIADLKTDIQSIQWVITAYALTLAALTITGGRLGDLWGRKKMFVVGAAIFAIGSFIASISHNVGTMIVGESIIEGIGAALMMPATLSLLVSSYQGRDRAIAMGVWGGVAGASSAVGPILGGFLTTNYSWRWGFRINIIVAIILIVGSIIIKECKDEKDKPTLDIFGVILSSLGLLSFVFGIIESSRYGWWRAKEVFVAFGHNISFGDISVVPVAMILGAVILACFLIWENYVSSKGKTPLVSLKLFKNVPFTSGVVNTAIMSIGQAGMIFAAPIFFQAVRGLDAYHTGLAFLPQSLAAFIFAPLTAIVFSKKISSKRLIQIGLLLFTLGLIVLRSELKIDAEVHDFIPGLVIFGIAIGVSMAELSNLTLSAVNVNEAGEASGINNTFRQIGSTLGSAIIGAALLTALTSNLSNGINKSTIIPTQAKEKISQAVSSQTTNVEFGGGAQVSANTPPVIIEEITRISHQATTDASREALLYAIGFAILGLILSVRLPENKDLN